jgi:hypothetical protein
MPDSCNDLYFYAKIAYLDKSFNLMLSFPPVAQRLPYKCLNPVIDLLPMHVPSSTQPFPTPLTLFIAEAEAQQEAHNSLQVHPHVSAALATDRSWLHWEIHRTWAVVTGRRLVEEACCAWHIRQAGLDNHLVERSSMCSVDRRIGDQPEPSCSY